MSDLRPVLNRMNKERQSYHAVLLRAPKYLPPITDIVKVLEASEQRAYFKNTLIEIKNSNVNMENINKAIRYANRNIGYKQ